METISIVGFVGQGFIGKHMADDFEERGHTVVRYALEEKYLGNREAIADCPVVFVAVPTPTTPTGFSDAAVQSALTNIRAGTIVVIKSTLLPGTTEQLQNAFPHLILLHSPEFLRERSAAYDARNPTRTIIGVPSESEEHRAAARRVLSILPKAPYECICTASEAELIKYAGNCFLATKVVFMNALYDLAVARGASYDVVRAAVAADERIGASHTDVVSASGHQGAVAGRGAGGHCFPKDLAAFARYSEDVLGNMSISSRFLKTIEALNVGLLRESGKDEDLLEGIYGARVSSLQHC